MRRVFLKSKIHRATVTGADLHYVGSIAIDPLLLEAADIRVNERVEVYNVTTGERWATYAVPGAGGAGAGDICPNGASAHKAKPGDLLIICSYAELEEHEISAFEPRLVFVDSRNRTVAAAALRESASVAVATK